MAKYIDLTDLRLSVKYQLISEKAENKKNRLTRKEAYKCLKYCESTILAVRKIRTNGQKARYVKMIEFNSDDKYLYICNYGRWAEKISYRAFNYNVQRTFNPRERVIFIRNIDYDEIEKRKKEIIEKENLKFDVLGNAVD